ncbi:LacI family transcriptional regulator [Diaminobutyricimonas aerilata]|uniref:LacI family transcriptional regulator n=1 Tax=Diaminobutyricimonas aerilata TaxID=1162967 RepID=A0A2M9CFQ2_9MICO|nr:LacI family DNA-binding transcriptional regulator [Diaminobutyricimonas aerilata]PJJ70774.1 LacI family transcriptional regulator [Diaminobutyricimonas aerilata]
MSIDHGSAPTLEKVAELAGVSRSTVSRVVNASPRVKPEVIRAVNDAIQKLGYVPNRAARTLASRRTQAIALVIPENTARFFADPFFASVIQGVAFRLAQTDYTLTLLIAAEGDPGKTRRYLQGGNVDGMLVLSHHNDDASYVDLAGRLPVVFGGRPMSRESENVHVVDVDNIDAASRATRHLIERGRTRIAHITGRRDMAAGIDRLTGWRRALDEAGLPAELVEDGDFTPEGGAAAMRRLLDRGEPIDAVFAASDQMAFGALNLLRERGMRVPDDVAVIGFDNNSYAISSRPELTTVEQPSIEFGTAMAEALVRLIDGEEVDTLTLLPTRLVQRAST